MITQKNLAFALFMICFTPQLAAFPSWERPVEPPSVTKFTSFISNPADPASMMVASCHQIYAGNQNGRWQPLWQTLGAAEKINRLMTFKEIPGAIFVLTSGGAFLRKPGERRWSEFYHGTGFGEKSVLSLAIDPRNRYRWLLGTENGLFESVDAGKTWIRFIPLNLRSRFPVIYSNGHLFFVAAGSQLFKSADLNYFEAVFELYAERSEDPSSGDSGEPDPAGDDLQNPSKNGIYELIAAGNDGNHLWLGTSQGVFESGDGGMTWDRLPSSGLQNSTVLHLVYAQKSERLFAASPSGIYIYRPDQKRWEEIFRAAGGTETRELAVVNRPEEKLLALNDDGIVQLSLGPEVLDSRGYEMPPAGHAQLFYQLIKLEPSAREVQQAVLRYANVRNGKIKRWQLESRLQALLPTLSINRSLSRANNIDIDRGSTNDADIFIAGPEDIDKDLSLNLNWHLSDFIWSSNQTAIDSREKLMIELRNDLLSEATRTYYERRRLQTEILFTPAVSELDYLENLNRLDELTAMLDAMTDGFMGQRLQRLYQKYPELRKLWENAVDVEQPQT